MKNVTDRYKASNILVTWLASLSAALASGSGEMVQVSIFSFRLSSICGGSFSKGKSQGQDKKTPVPLWQSLIFFKREVAPPLFAALESRNQRWSLKL